MVSSGVYQPSFYIWPATYYGHWWGEAIQGNSIVSNTIWGYGGDDTLTGNVGEDWLFGGAGNDSLFGGDGNDHLLGDIGDDWIWGGNGNDSINGEDGNDRLYGEAGDDLIYGGDGVDVIHSGAGNDEIHGDGGDDWLYLDGNTTFNQNYDNLVLAGAYGGDGNDYLEGSGNFGVLDGGNGDDNIYGGSGTDLIYAGDGDDTVVAGGGSDEIHAGPGHDKVFAGDGNDWIFLGPDTYAEGNGGNDLFYIAPEQLNGSTFYAVGGEGHDTFRMDLFGIGAGSMDLPLPAISLRVESIEELDFQNLISKTDMHLKADDILDFTETGLLQIDGNQNQTLHLEGGGWKDAGASGPGFHDYVAASNNQVVTAHVDTDIQVVIA